MRIIYLLAAFFFAASMQAQETQLEPCGTPSFRSEWLKNYQKNPNAYDKRTGVVMWVPISVTLVGEDDGSGYISERTVHESLCTLNDDFAESEIQFYLASPFRYLNNSTYATHGNVLVGAEMMFANNLPDMINTYIVGNASGFCGYNLPYAGVVMSAGCAQPQDHTWAHEIGHNLSIQHPFLGWEGGIGTNGTNPNYSNPAPEMVTYDYTYFKDTLIIDTIIIDTIAVEKMDGSNCAFAADGFCDTKPDYLAVRWQCDGDNKSLQEQTDPNGEKFYSDGSWIMSYALDACSSKFSPEQIAAMRANLIDEKSSYLGNENVLPPPATDAIEILTPAPEAEVYYEDVYIEWEPVENATAYTMQFALFSSFGGVVFDTIVYNNYVTIPRLQFSDKKHYYRLKALNEYNFCSEYLTSSSFQAVETQTSVNDTKLSEIEVYPTMLSISQNIVLDNKEQHTYEITVNDLVGRQLLKDTYSSRIEHINTEGWAEGVYLVSLRKEHSIITHKISIVN